jgi:ABC-type transport system involved in Fe-S cluster assembly fused permease/ATPase subunit
VEDGQIAETGEHNELIGSDGKYAELYAAQLGD